MPPNICINRSAKRHRRLVPVALRAPALGYAGRYVSCADCGQLWQDSVSSEA